MASASPSSAVASSVAASACSASSPVASRRAASMPSGERSRSGWEANSEVGTIVRFTTAVVRPGASFGRFSALVATTRSQPISRSAEPAAMRVAWIASGCSAMRTWLVTGPFFWERPVTSSSEQPLPSRCAAMPSSAPTVTTPVPPMPATSTSKGRSQGAGAGSGRPAKTAPPVVSAASARARRTRPPFTLTKLGQ